MLQVTSDRKLTAVQFKAPHSKGDYSKFLSALQSSLNANSFTYICVAKFCKEHGNVNREVFASLVNKGMLIENAITRNHKEYKRSAKFHELTPERIYKVLSAYLTNKYADSWKRSNEKQKATRVRTKHPDLVFHDNPVAVDVFNNATTQQLTEMINNQTIPETPLVNISDAKSYTDIAPGIMEKVIFKKQQKPFTSEELSSITRTTPVGENFEASWNKNGEKFVVSINVQGSGEPRSIIEKALTLMDI